MHDLFGRAAAGLLAGCLVVVAAPAAANAAPQAGSLRELAASDALAIGKELLVTVRLQRGGAFERMKLRVVDVSEGAIRVELPDGFSSSTTDLPVQRLDPEGTSFDGPFVLELPEDRIARVAKVDSLENGLLIGATTGAAAAGLITLTGCWGRDNDPLCGALIAAGAGIGAGIGVAADALRSGEGTVLFDGSSEGSGLIVSTAPILSRDRKGVAFSVRW